MITFIENNIIKDIKINYGTSFFSDVGDELIFPIPEGGFTPDYYPRRHIITSGSFKIDWMVGGTPLGLYHIFTKEDKQNLLIFPYKHQPCDAIKLTALEPNSSYLCVVPLLEKNYRLLDKSFVLQANENFKLSRGQLYVCNHEIDINGIKNPPLKPFACVYNELEITPQEDCFICSFYVIEKS